MQAPYKTIKFTKYLCIILQFLDRVEAMIQVTLQCVSLGRSALPIWMEALNGNSSDKKSFPETVKRVNAFYKQVESAQKMCFVADSAL